MQHCSRYAKRWTFFALTPLFLSMPIHAEVASPNTATPANITTYASVDNYCSIEVGSKGVKARLYRMKEDAEGYLSIDTDYKNDVNTTIIKSMQDGKFSEAAMDETTKAVKDEMGKMLGQSPKCKAFVVGSSGVAKASNKDTLAQKVTAATTVGMEFINAEEEARYAFLASVPIKYRNDSLLIDIGSGNTKLAYRDGEEIKTLEVPYGSASLAKEMQEKQQANFATDDYKKKVTALIQPDFRGKAQTQPKLLNHKRLYWIGGAAWATATYTYPEHSEESVVRIYDKDLRHFAQRLEQNDWLDTHVPKKASDSAKKAHEKDWEKVKSTFTREDLLSALALMDVIVKDGNPKSRINFLRYGQWLYGYTREKYKSSTH